MAVTEWGYRNFEGFPPILILAVLGIIVKHKVTQFYTAPNSGALLKKVYYVQKIWTAKVVVLWINEEAWHWYNDHVGAAKQRNRGIMISPIPFVTKPTYVFNSQY
jgi:acetyl-CoA synthetase